jgi:hypothetical protein
VILQAECESEASDTGLREMVGAEVPFFRDVNAFVAWAPPKIEARGVMHRQVISTIG